MNGARAIFETLAAGGVSVCFANPGTTEVDLVHALDDVPAIDPVLVLHETVATGAADGYGRMLGRPASTLLHLGPGYANGASNLHNAWRARTPIINVVGDHATWHRPFDTGLASDIAGLASVHSGRVVEVTDPGRDAAACFEGDGISTLVVPVDVARGSASPGVPQPAPAPAAVPEERFGRVVDLLLSDEPVVLVVDGPAALGTGLDCIGSVAAATGAGLFHATLPARVERGEGRPPLRRLPYAPERALAVLAGATVVPIGAAEPTTFFGYDGIPSRLAEGRLVRGADPDEDVQEFCERLADRLGAVARSSAGSVAPSRPTGTIDVASLGAAVAATQPEGAIVVNAAVTSGGGWESASAGAPLHDMLTVVGGSLGFGLPAAVGAAIACPDRRVVALVADGSAMYAPQALWNLSRQGLDVTVVALVNGRYRIIDGELARVRPPGPVAAELGDIGGLDFGSLAAAFGVPAVRPADADELTTALEASFSEPGPVLVEVVL